MRAALLASLLLLLVPRPAGAGEPAHRALIVLDRGQAAKEDATVDAGNALRIWHALAARGVDARLVACGVDQGGKTTVQAVSPTRASLEALSKVPGLAFGGPTDPRIALGLALQGEGPVDVVLLGPFGPLPEGEEGAAAPGKKALAGWNADAAEGSRLIAVRSAAGVLARLEGARGLARKGLLVVGFGPPEVVTGPFSALRRDADRMEARVRVLADVLPLGAEDRPGAVLTASSDVAEDEITSGSTAGLHTFVLRRRARDGRTATLAFKPRGGVVATWLCAPPQPLTFQWEHILSEATLVGADGTPARPFAAIDVTAEKPRTMTYRLRRARTGPAPAWHVAAQEGELPSGLHVDVGREVGVSPEIGESPVRVTFTAEPGRPLKAAGTIVLSADGIDAPLKLPFEIRVQPGHARLEADVKVAALPRAAKDALTALRVVAVGGNAPRTLALHAVCDGGQETWLRALLLDAAGSRTVWKLDEPLPVDVGSEHRLAFQLDEKAPPELPFPCKVTLRADAPGGARVDGEVVLTVRRRLPHLTLGGPAPTYSLQNGALVSKQPIVLRLDADGGDGEWLVSLLSTPPTVRSLRDAPIGWQAVTQEPGVWHIVPTGEWSGRTPSVFTAAEQHLEIQVDWAPGATPGTIGVTVEIPPRWGTRGLVILILALLALVLAVLVVGYMRTPAVTGTLLYTVEGVEGTVGRLDLAAVGRRLRPITADGNGKLTVAGKGRTLGRVRPTRVGGMLEYVDSGGSKERRLLVDGVSLRIGRHLVRYVSGRAAETRAQAPAAQGEDLLGPEYDIESGRIEALGDDEPTA